MKETLSILNGMQIHTNPNLPRFKVVQYRFPRTKKLRIRKKWAKRKNNYHQVSIKTMYVLGKNNLVMHTDDFAKLNNMLKKSCENSIKDILFGASI